MYDLHSTILLYMQPRSRIRKETMYQQQNKTERTKMYVREVNKCKTANMKSRKWRIYIFKNTSFRELVQQNDVNLKSENTIHEYLYLNQTFLCLHFRCLGLRLIHFFYRILFKWTLLVSLTRWDCDKHLCK